MADGTAAAEGLEVTQQAVAGWMLLSSATRPPAPADCPGGQSVLVSIGRERLTRELSRWLDSLS